MEDRGVQRRPHRARTGRHGHIAPAVLAVALLACAAAATSASSIATSAREGSACGRPLAHLSRSQSDPFRASSLRAYLAGRAGVLTAAIYDRESEATYLYRRGVREPTASIVKVDILATLLHERQAAGGLSPGEEATAVAMIEHSDNGAATTLWNSAGGAPAVAAFNAQAGLPETRPSSAWGLTTTSARDQLELLRCVMEPNRLLDLSSRVNAYELMSHVASDQRWGISAGARGAAVALKNGWLPIPGSGWEVNSIGAVAGAGRSYLIAVLTGEQPTEGYGIATIEHIAAATWRALAPPRAPRRHRHHRRRTHRRGPS